MTLIVQMTQIAFRTLLKGKRTADLADLLRFPFLISDSLMESHTDDADCSDDTDGVK